MSNVTTVQAHELQTLYKRLMGSTPPVTVQEVNAPPTGPVAPVAPIPAMPGTRLDNIVLPPDVLQLGNQHFGAPVRFGQIRELGAGITPEEAAKLTKNNGMDEIYFTDEKGKHYVLFAEKARFRDVQAGYFGRVNINGELRRVKVVAVEDENNTFYQGMMSTWRWLHSVLTNSFGNEATKSVSGLVTTAIGSFVAAAALKGTAPTAAAPVTGGFLKTVGSAFGNAVNGFLQTMASVVLFAVGAVGVFSIFTGVKGHFRKGEMTTIDMVTGQY